MISVIIPTLFKVDRLLQTLTELSDCDEVGEIILIDNTDNLIPIILPKLKHICEGRNTYVNPAWNKGVKLSSFDKLLILNDDMWFDFSYLKDISVFITPSVGMIGMSSDMKEEFKIVPIETHFTDDLTHRPDGFGCCFFIHKSRYVPIPEELKIWCGDDWLFYQDRNINYLIEGIKFDGHVSATFDDKNLKPHFDEVSSNDISVMRKLIKQKKIVDFFAGSWWGKTE